MARIPVEEEHKPSCIEDIGCLKTFCDLGVLGEIDFPIFQPNIEKVAPFPLSFLSTVRSLFEPWVLLTSLGFLSPIEKHIRPHAPTKTSAHGNVYIWNLVLFCFSHNLHRCLSTPNKTSRADGIGGDNTSRRVDW